MKRCWYLSSVMDTTGEVRDLDRLWDEEVFEFIKAAEGMASSGRGYCRRVSN